MSRGATARKNRRMKRYHARQDALVAAAQEGVGDALTAGASGSTDFPLSDRGRAWDASAANKRWQSACGIGGDSPDWSKFHTGFFWYDSAEPEQVGSHKLPFVDVVDGKATAVWRGVTAGAARLSSTQGLGSDKSAVQSRMASYYGKAAKQYDDPTIKPPWKSDASAVTAEFAVRFPDDAMSEAVEMLIKRAVIEPADQVDALAPDYAKEMLNATLTQFAAKMTGKCADCGHMAMAHGGDNNMGACSMKGCDCTGYATKADSDTHAAAPFEFEVTTNGGDPVTVSLGNEFWVDATGSWNIVTGTSSNVYFTFDIETEEAAKSGHGTGKGGRPGWKNIKIPPSRPVRSVPKGFPAPKVSPHADDPETFDATVELPADHQPGQQLPPRNASPKAPASTLPDPNSTLAWTATLAPEGKATDDGRVFAPGSITWRELPLSLMGMTKTADGHDGAEVCGRIDRIWRDGNMIRASGVFSSSEYGQKIATAVNDGELRGVSVDIAPQKVDMAYRSEVVDADGNWLDTAPEESTDDGPSPLDLLFGGDNKDDPVIYVVRKAVLGMATVCPFQAFADAKIEPAASLVAAGSDAVWTVTMNSGMTIVAKALTAAAVDVGDLIVTDAQGEEIPIVSMPVVITASAAGLAIDDPPLAWFDPPSLNELTALTIDDDGRVYGHAAAWGTCHIGIQDTCTTAPRSMTNYSYFHLKEVVCDDGDRVSCGTITMDTGHAGQSLGRAAAAAHYDDTGLAVADVVCGEDQYGIWVAGAIRPGADADAVRRLRGAALSGDWRNVNGNLELVGLLAVNVPGFPIPRVRAELTASAAGLEVTALVAAGAHLGLDGLTAEQRSQWAELSTIAADEWGRLNRLALDA